MMMTMIRIGRKCAQMISSYSSHSILSPVACLTNLVPVPFLQVFPFLLLLFEGDHAIYWQRHCPWFSKYLNYIHFYALQRSKNLNQSKIMTSPKIQEESTTVDNLDRWSLPPSVLGLLLWWTEGGRLSESAGWRLHWSPRSNCISAKTSQLGPIRSGIVTIGTEAPESFNHHQISNILNSDALRFRVTGRRVKKSVFH